MMLVRDHYSVKIGFPIVFFEQIKSSIIGQTFRHYYQSYLIADIFIALIISGLNGYCFKLCGISRQIRKKYEA